MTEKAPFLGMYVHVPFCSTTCDFCAFYQERPSKKGINSFFKGLEHEIEHFSNERPFSTIFVGGGTPGLLSADQIRRLGSLIRTHRLEEGIEWSMEIAPSEISHDKLEAMAEIGVNRISLGVQTFDPDLMRELGRAHGAERVFEAYSMIREVGACSVNLDLIFGIPGQTLETWERDMIRAIEMEPDHLSTYCLTFEEDTALYVRLSQGKVSVDPEREAAFYERAWEFLPQAGFEQYEISNYAREGHACRHNLNTWSMNEWIGYGPSAASQINGIRRKNLSNLEEWSRQWENPEALDFEECERLSPADLAEDAVMFGLRMNRGIDLADLAGRFGLSISAFGEIERFLLRLQGEGLARKDPMWKLTAKGRILADAVAKELPGIPKGSANQGLG